MSGNCLERILYIVLFFHNIYMYIYWGSYSLTSLFQLLSSGICYFIFVLLSIRWPMGASLWTPRGSHLESSDSPFGSLRASLFDLGVLLASFWIPIWLRVGPFVVPFGLLLRLTPKRRFAHNDFEHALKGGSVQKVEILKIRIVETDV